MRDILDDAHETLAEITERRPLQTHYDGCRRNHTGCLIAAMIREIERLRLTDFERATIETCAKHFETAAASKVLRGLLKRTQNST